MDPKKGKDIITLKDRYEFTWKPILLTVDIT